MPSPVQPNAPARPVSTASAEAAFRRETVDTDRRTAHVLPSAGMHGAAPFLGPFRAVTIGFPAAGTQARCPLGAAGAVLSAGSDGLK